jgi:hypothetical protein
MRLFTIIILNVAIAVCQGPVSTGLLHTHSGRIVGKGRFDLTINSNYWSKSAKYRDPAADSLSQNARYMAANIGLTYGFTRHFEVALISRIYQDTRHQPKENNLPDDLFLQFKLGSYDFQRRHFSQAFMLSSRLPTGKVHNYPFAEFASGSIEYGIGYAVSFFKSADLPHKETQVHFNLGWWNHNENGKDIDVFDSDPITATVNSNYLGFALAAILPASRFNFRMELSGAFYITRPDRFVYSAEDWILFTPSVRYNFSDAVSMDLGVDLRLNSGDTQYTTGVPDISEVLNLSKNYPPWKVHLGLNFTLSHGEKRNLQLGLEGEKYDKRMEYYQLIQEEEKKADASEKEYNQLHKERQNADDEIEDLRETLEGQD